MHFNESILDSHSDPMRVIRCLGEEAQSGVSPRPGPAVIKPQELTSLTEQSTLLTAARQAADTTSDPSEGEALATWTFAS